MILTHTEWSDNYWVMLLLWNDQEEKYPLYLIEIPVDVVQRDLRSRQWSTVTAEQKEFRWKKIADTSRFLSLSPSYVLSLVLNYDEWFWGGLCLLQQALLSPSEYFLPSRWCVLSHFYQWLRVFTIQSNHCRVSSKFIPLAKSGIRCWFESLNVG